MPKSENSLKEIIYDLRRIEEHREKLTEEKIRQIYKNLIKDLRAFLADTYIDYADVDGRLLMQTMREKARYARFLQEAAERVDGITPALRQEMLDLAEETHSRCYEGMVAAVQSASNTQELAAMLGNDTLVRPEVLQQYVDNNISKLTLPDVMEKYRAAIVYDIKQTLTIGLINGDRYEDMVKRVEQTLVGYDGTKGYYGKACNIVRTETGRNIEAGFMDCAENIQAGLEGSGLIYTATWRTMKDERVRPNQRYKTKKGWVTKISKNGADHVKMEGVTVKAGDLFKLEPTVFTKCPKNSGYSRHDCNCRCFIEYDLMTPEEFAKATKNPAYLASVHSSIKEKMNASGIADVELQRTTDVEAFDKAIRKMKEHGGAAACVDTHPLEEMKDFKLFLAKNEMAGVAVKPDGDITAVFKNPDYKQRGAVNDLIITARANGGDKMDCYGIGLVNMYEKCGYVPVARIPFNADYVDDPYLLATRPDVYAMMKNTDSLDTVIQKNAAKSYKLSMQADLDNLPTYEDYDEALRFRDNLLKEQK